MIQQESSFNDTPLQEQYAVAFRNVFSDSFDSCVANDEDEFTISGLDFDQFVINSGFSLYSRLPIKHSAEWSKFRGESNAIRSSLNKSSTYGEHGEPPYRIDYKAGNMIVRLMTAMFRVTNAQMAKKLLSLATNQNAQHTKMHDFLLENLDALPVELQGLVNIQDTLFNGVIKRLRRDLIDYSGSIESVYEQATLFIKPPQEQLALENNNNQQAN